MSPEEKIRFKNEISLHNHNYYVLSKPVISDYEFDQLYNELIVLRINFQNIMMIIPHQELEVTFH